MDPRTSGRDSVGCWRVEPQPASRAVNNIAPGQRCAIASAPYTRNGPLLLGVRDTGGSFQPQQSPEAAVGPRRVFTILRVGASHPSDLLNRKEPLRERPRNEKRPSHELGGCRPGGG